MNIRKRIWWLLPAVCLFIGALAALLLWCIADFHWSFALKQGLAFTGTLAVTTSLAFFLLRAYPTKVGILGYAAVTGAIIGAIGVLMHSAILMWLLHPAEQSVHAGWMRDTADCMWILYPALLLLFSITTSLYKRMDEIEGRYNLQQDAVTLLKEAELFKLRQQLQPHFMYNSLNAISSLIITAPDQASEMISRLADFLRASVRQGRSELVTLEEELEYLRTYLWIEAVRFGDRLHVDWAADVEVNNTKLPPFLLQPLMENALRYGVYGNTGSVTIRISIQLMSGMLQISISNPYDPTMRATGGTGFGLEGVRRRLQLLYARGDLLQTSEAAGIYTTTIQIPQ